MANQALIDLFDALPSEAVPADIRQFMKQRKELFKGREAAEITARGNIMGTSEKTHLSSFVGTCASRALLFGIMWGYARGFIRNRLTCKQPFSLREFKSAFRPGLKAGLGSFFLVLLYEFDQ